MTGGNYEEFNPLSEIGFHINGIVVLIGLLLSLFMFFHALYEWKWKECRNKKPIPNPKKKQSSIIIYSSLILLLLSILLFVTYFIEFFWLRVFVPTTYNYSSYTFCNRFSPCLFISIFVVTYGIVHYFLIRLECSFKGSVLAYPKSLYITLRFIAVILIVLALVFVIIATDGLPYDVEKNQVTNEHPWLCRNGIKSNWPTFWFILNVFGLFFMLGFNFLNWYLFINRLNKLLELGLSTDDSFIAFYSNSSKHRKKTTEHSYSSSDNIEMVAVDACPDVEPSASYRITTVYEKVKNGRKRSGEERQERKNRRARKERVLYALIKRQTILTGIVFISGAIFWAFQITVDEGSTMTMCAVIVSVVCVYLSFSFKIKCFDFCCGKCMDDCTCIEDRIERKIARKIFKTLRKDNMLEIIDERASDEQKDSDDLLELI